MWMYVMTTCMIASKVVQYFKSGINACVLPAVRPKGGKVHLFSSEDNAKKGQELNAKRNYYTLHYYAVSGYT